MAVPVAAPASAAATPKRAAAKVGGATRVVEEVGEPWRGATRALRAGLAVVLAGPGGLDLIAQRGGRVVDDRLQRLGAWASSIS